MHIMFSIDTPFLAPQNGDARGGKLCTWLSRVSRHWTPTIGERLSESCQTEDSNAFDPYAVAIRKNANVIGHIPRKISAVCSLFI